MFEEFKHRTAKQALSRQLKISLATLYKYESVARTYIGDYLSHFPRLDDEIITSIGLDDYQVWVLNTLVNRYWKASKIFIISEFEPKDESTTFADLFSFASYQKYLNKRDEEAKRAAQKARYERYGINNNVITLVPLS